MKYFCINFKYILLFTVLFIFWIGKQNISSEYKYLYPLAGFTIPLVIAVLIIVIALFTNSEEFMFVSSLPFCQYFSYILFAVVATLIWENIDHSGMYITIFSFFLLVNVYILAYIRTNLQGYELVFNFELRDIKNSILNYEFMKNFLREFPFIFIIFDPLFFLLKRKGA